nr:hypothetical protein KPHV_56180 [Kitasatospora purpeofusca]
MIARVIASASSAAVSCSAVPGSVPVPACTVPACSVLTCAALSGAPVPGEELAASSVGVVVMGGSPRQVFDQGYRPLRGEPGKMLSKTQYLG